MEPSAAQQAARPLLTACLVVAALTGLRLAVLAGIDIDLYADEARYWAWAQQPAFGYVSKPPLVAWLIAATTAVGGDSPFWVRLSSPLLHGATSVVLFHLGHRLYGPQVGLWTAVTHATLPAVSFSAMLVSTDVPLLFFWAVALLAFINAMDTRRIGWAALLGAAVGLGLLSKYAMGYFVACAVAYCAVAPERRRFLRSRQAAIAGGIALLLFAPNLWWNLDHSLVTLGHVVDNASWKADWFHPLRMLEFFGSQFGVFGPILFASLLVGLWRMPARRMTIPADRVLLFLSLPVLLLILAQALVSRALANWAAPAYVAATLLVSAWLCRLGNVKLLQLSLALHGLVMLGLYAFLVFAAGTPLPRSVDPMHRILGWARTADAVRQQAAGSDFTGIVIPDQSMMPEMAYYLRPQPAPLLTWPRITDPRLALPGSPVLDVETGRRVLLVLLRDDAAPYAAPFRTTRRLGAASVPLRKDRGRDLFFYLLEDYGTR